ncbi:hypothetical protein L218DRAFT_963870 [Marasmius fiardii PR-910]|nr:hypothetical protein L218DRAFT_963870 [Marasmius fiardii PR-910]
MAHLTTIRKVRSCPSIPNNPQTKQELTPTSEALQLANTVGAALIKSQVEQYSEHPTYGMLNVILSRLMFLVKPDLPERGDRFLVCPQLRRIPHFLGQQFTLHTITSAIPDLDFMLMNIFRFWRQLVILMVEVKRLTAEEKKKKSEEQGKEKSSKGKEKSKEKEERHYARHDLDWADRIQATSVLRSEFVASLQELFTQAICTFACNILQESVSLLFVCGCYYYLVEFSRPPRLEKTLEEANIHVIQKTSDGTKYTTNNPVQIPLIFKLFPHPVAFMEAERDISQEKEGPAGNDGECSNSSRIQEDDNPGSPQNPVTPNFPKVIRGGECMFENLESPINKINVRWPPKLSTAFRTLLWYILTKYGLHCVYHPYFALSEAIYQPPQNSIAENQMLIENWYRQKYYQQAAEDAILKHTARSTGSFFISPQRDLRTDEYITTPERLPKHLREPEESPGYQTPIRGKRQKNDVSKTQLLTLGGDSEDSDVEEDPEDDANSDNDDMCVDDSDADDGSNPFDAGF